MRDALCRCVLAWKPAVTTLSTLIALADTERVLDLRARVREAMKRPPVTWDCPQRIDERHLAEPLPVRKARAVALKLSAMALLSTAHSQSLAARHEQGEDGRVGHRNRPAESVGL